MTPAPQLSESDISILIRAMQSDTAPAEEIRCTFGCRTAGGVLARLYTHWNAEEALRTVKRLLADFHAAEVP